MKQIAKYQIRSDVFSLNMFAVKYNSKLTNIRKTEHISHIFFVEQASLFKLTI